MASLMSLFIESKALMGEVNKDEFHRNLISLAKQWYGEVFLVGGAVRDQLLGFTPKDLDYVITKITLDDLSNKLKQTFPHAKVSEVGESFGIVKLTIDNEEFDFAIPRADIDRDNVKVDPNIPIESDLLRRDFTCNSLAKNLENGVIVSPVGFDGIQDIKDRVLRATGVPKDRFVEDPLRILRGLQISARFGFTIEENTLKAMSELRSTLHSISSERFYEEFKKAWTKGNADVITFFYLLNKTGIGKEIFGESFEPIPFKLKSIDTEENFLGQYMSAFYNGGNYQMLSKKVVEHQWIEAIHTVSNLINKVGNETIISASKKLGKQSDKFPLILKVLKVIDPIVFDGFTKILKKPFIPKVSKEYVCSEFPITTGELIELFKQLGLEIKGKDIQDAFYHLILDYHNGSIPLDSVKEKNINYLSNHIKERYGQK